MGELRWTDLFQCKQIPETINDKPIPAQSLEKSMAMPIRFELPCLQAVPIHPTTGNAHAHASVNLSKTMNDGLPVNVTLFFTRQIFGLIV